MPGPKINLDVIADFIIQVGKVKTDKLVKAIRKQVNGIQIDPIDVDALINPTDGAQFTKALEGVRSGIASIEEASKRLPQNIRTAIAELGKVRGFSQSIKEAGGAEAVAKEVERLAFQDLRSIKATYETAERLRSQFVSESGFTLDQSREFLSDLTQGKRALPGEGQGRISELTAQQAAAAREAFEFNRGQLLRAKQLEKLTESLTRTITIPPSDEATQAALEEGRQVKGKSAPGTAVSLPGIGSSIQALGEFQSAAERALNPQPVRQLNEEFQGMRATIRDGLTPGLRDLDKQIGRLNLPDEITAGLRDEAAEARRELETTRTLRDQLGSTRGLETRERIHKELMERIAMDEKRQAVLREGIERQVARAREKFLGQYISRSGEMARQVLAQSQRDVGPRLLKGAETEELAIRQVRGRDEAEQILGTLTQRTRDAAGALFDYGQTINQATAAQDRQFINLQERLFEQQRLQNLASDRFAQITNATTSAADRKAADLDRKTQSQLTRIDEIERRLGEQRTRDDRQFLGTDERATFDTDESRRLQELQDIRAQVLAGATEPLVAERSEALKNQTADIDRLNKSVQGLERSYRDAAKEGKRLFEQRPQQVSADQGDRILDERGLSENAIRSLSSYEELSQVIDSLDRKQNDLLDTQRRQLAETREFGEEETRRNQQTVAQLTEIEQLRRVANQEIRTFDLDDNQLRSKVDSVSSSMSSLSERVQKTGSEFDKLTRGLADDDVDRFRGRLERVRTSLEELREQSVRTFDDATDSRQRQRALEEYESGLNDIKRTYRELTEEISTNRAEVNRFSRESQAIQAQQGRERIERLAREEGIYLPEDRRRLPVEAVTAAVGAIGASSAVQNQELAAALAERVTLATQDLGRARVEAARSGSAGEARRVSDLEKQEQQLKDLQKLAQDRIREEDKLRRNRLAGEVFPEEVADEDAILARQPFVDLKEFKSNRELLGNLDRVNQGLEQRRQAVFTQIQKLRGELGDVGGASPEIDRLEKEFQDLGRQIAQTTKLTEGLRRRLDEISRATSAENIAKVQLGREKIADDVIRRAGGVEALARTTQTLRQDDVGQLPLVRDTLQRRLVETEASLARQVADGATRQSEGYKKASREALVLEKAIARVNTRMRGYFTLTGQIGALARQFARYGIGYAALYQALFGVRQLAAGVIELDSALISIRAVTQATDDEMRTIEKSIKRVALATQFTTGEIAKAAQVLAQAGVEAEDFPSALTAVAAFASATESSIQVSADLLSSMRNIFKDIEDLQIANQLTQAVNISKLTAEDLKTIISLSAQMAKSFNLASDQYLSAVTTLRNAGIKASTVATGLRQALIEVFSPDTKTIKILQERSAQLGETTSPDDIRQRFFQFSQTADPLESVLRELRRLGFAGAGQATFSGRTFDVRAENAIIGLINNLDEYVESQAQVVFGNAAITASQTQMEALAASAKNLGAALISTSHDLSQDLLPAIEDLIDGLTDAVEGLAEFDSKLRLQGSSFGDILFSALTTAAVAFPLTRGQGFVRGTGLVTGAALAGGAVATATQEASAEAGLGSGQQDLTRDLAAVGTGALLLSVGKIIEAVRAPGNFFKNLLGIVAPVQKELFAGTRAASGLIPRVMGGFRAIFSFFRLSSPLGWVVGLGGLLLSARSLFDSYEAEANQAQRQLDEALKRSNNAQANFDLFQDQRSQFRPSDPGGGYEAPRQSIAGQAEELRDQIGTLGETLANLFGASTDLTTAVNQRILESLRAIEQVPEEGAAREIAIENLQRTLTEELDQGLANFGATPSSRSVLNELVALVSQVDRNAAGQLDAVRSVYEQAGDLTAGELEDLNDNFAFETREAINNAGLKDAIKGFSDLGFIEVAELLENIIAAAEESRFALDLASRTLDDTAVASNQTLEAKLRALVSGYVDFQQTLQAALDNAPVPTTVEGIQQVREQRTNLLGRLEALQARREREQELPEIVGQGRSANAQRLRRGRETLSDYQFERIEAALIAQMNANDRQQSAYQQSLLRTEATREKSIANTVVNLRTLQSLADQGNEVAQNFIGQLNAAVDPELTPETPLAGIAARVLGLDSDEARRFDNRLEADVAAPLVTIDGDVINEPSKQAISSLGALVDQILKLSFASEKARDSLIFEDTPEFADTRQRIFSANQGLRDARFNRNFPLAEQLLQERFQAQLEQLDAQQAFTVAEGPGSGPRAEAQYRTKLATIRENRLRTEAEFNEERRSIGEQTLRFERQRLKEQLDNLEKAATAAANDPNFTDLSGLSAEEQQYRQAVQEYIRLIQDTAERFNLTEDGEAAIQAAQAEYAAGLLVNADVLEEAARATQSYLDALPGVFNALFLRDPQTVQEAVFEADRGRRPDRAQLLDANRFQFQANREQLGVLTAREGAARVRFENEELALQRLQDQEASEEALTAQRTRVNAARDALIQVREQITGVREDLALLEDEARGLQFDILGELEEGFDATALFQALEDQAMESVMSISDNVRDAFVQAFEGVSSLIVDAAFGDLDGSFASELDDLVKNIFRDLAKSILQAAVQSAITRSIGFLLPGIGGVATGGTISGGTVAPSGARTGGTVTSGRVLPPLRRNTGGLIGAPTREPRSLPRIPASSSPVPPPIRRATGGMIDGPPGQILARALGIGQDGGIAVTRNFESERMEQRELVKEAITDLQKESPVRRGMGGMLPALRRGQGGPIDRMSLGDAIRRTHGGVIKGPGSGTSDSIPGVIVDEMGRPQRGILVSNGEAILNKEATSKLGKDTIDFINTNASRFASGGVVSKTRSIHNAVTEIYRGSSGARPATQGQSESMDGVAGALSSLSSQLGQPTELNLEVSDSALNVTLRDYIESYMADVVARR